MFISCCGLIDLKGCEMEYVGELLYTKPISSKTASVICPICGSRVHFELVEGKTTHDVICPACMFAKR